MDNEKEYLESSEGEDEMSDNDSIIDNNEKKNIDDDIDEIDDVNDSDIDEDNDDNNGLLDDEDDDNELEKEDTKIINNLNNTIINRENFDDEDDDEFDETYFQKLNKDVHDNIIENYHPELKVHNAHEIKAACKITRDDNGNIVDPLHKTLPFITCYEKTRIIGERAKQINEGAKPFVEVDKSIIDGYLIALQEFKEKKIPFIIQRPLPNGNSEYWRFCDLECLE